MSQTTDFPRGKKARHLFTKKVAGIFVVNNIVNTVEKWSRME
jgi:hypothetical protein